MMSFFPVHLLAASWNFGDLLEIIIVVIVVIIAPLAQTLIKFFSPKPEQGNADVSRPKPQHRQRPTAQAMPMDRVPTPPAPPARLARPLARPLPSGSSGPALERVRPLAAETAPAEPVARRVPDDDEASRLPEMLLEMLGVPAEELRRRVPQDRQEQQQRRQQRKQAEREAKTSAARPKLSPPPPSRRTSTTPQEPEKHVSIHSRLPSEVRSEAALSSRGKVPRAPDGAAAGVPSSSARGLTRLAGADKSELRRAMLLSEVLGLPVSMRPPRDFPD